MTRIRNFIFGTRRKSILLKVGTSFNSLNNERTPEKDPVSMESSFNDNFKFSPDIFNKASNLNTSEYGPLDNSGENINCSKTSYVSILIAVILVTFLFILPIIYLLHCFGLIYMHANETSEFELEDQYNHINKFNFEDFKTELINDTVKNVFKIEELKEQINLTYPPKPDNGQCKFIRDEDKIDCFPQRKSNQLSCENRGCCWASLKDNHKINSNVPYCFYSQNYPSYYYLNITETAFGLIAYLKRDYKTPYPDDIKIIKLIVKYETDSRLHFKIIDPLKHRFEPPYPELPIVDRAVSNLKYKFVINSVSSGFKVVRKSDNAVIFDALNFTSLIFANQLLQFSAKLPTKKLYGIGEHRTRLVLSTDWSKFTLFNHDAIPQFNKNLYGSHAFYLALEKSNNAHAVLFLNSNAMDIILQPSPIITYRAIGGVFDFFIFLGPTASDVVSQYTDLIGRPYMPPYWGLGFHLCRFGYKSLNDTKMVMQRNINAGIPLDTQWNDLDYMNNSNDFTYDKLNFKELPEFIKNLHEKGMHYIPLIDPGISASEKPGSYPPYDDGVMRDIFVKNSSGQIFIGKVWNKGSTVWPDFTHPNTVDYWTKNLQALHNEINFDGAWIDMNEPSNFLSGSFNGCPNNSLEHPPYVPGIDGGVLNYKTMCMSSKHFAGLHYDVHNLYGFTEAIVTNFAMAEIRGKRPMVISRSSFPGLGRYAGHWSGDVVSAWLDMKYTIPQLLTFNMFGIPLMGADICGFNGNTTVNLCNRWMQLGAFYPFSRNHNTDDGIAQDPAALGDMVVKSSIKALKARYSLLPYLYTLFWRSHVYGETVARPLFFEFTNDEKTHSLDTQFLWGPALLIIPVLEENKVAVEGYFPKGIWYNFYSKAPTLSRGEYFNISAPLDTIPLFIRGGYIIPRQSPKQTTTESRKSSIQLLVALNEEGSSDGQLYWDDGDSLNTYEEKRFSLSQFSASDNILKVKNLYRREIPPILSSITIMGVQKIVLGVFINGTPIKTFNYDAVNKVLTITKLDFDWKDNLNVNWK